ncbi:GNAT family N-acetyltransferase [Dactylosporangium matsuzakiense]|uniref:Enhanced intracellular survival protein n=1 Tax=Dactylosporangium matsuzakiense TaxID=53360 RepID=A0A9W6NMM4_9ACTN|nr:GNAT family N-acetyltransferase [Dactylosporangium matsuzakiense]GLL02112.1 enhanced intracellular survival protein [Dactylosporangium matsuzakiense]
MTASAYDRADAVPALTIRRVRPDELTAFLRVLGDAYGRSVDDYFVDAWRGAFDYDRNRGLFLGDRLVGTGTSGLVSVTAPGPTTVSVACTGNLTVDGAVTIPGLAERMFRQQCREHRDEGLPFVVFTVMDIMKKFHFRVGSAPVTESVRLSLTPDRSPVADGHVHGSVEDVPLGSAELRDVHRDAAATTVGMMIREPAWMGAVRRLAAVPVRPEVWGYREAGRLQGFAVFRPVSDSDGRRTVLVVDELTTIGPAACHALVGRLLASGADQVVIEHWRLDDPLRIWLGDRVGVQRGPLRDGLWMRILDVPGTLTSRQYAGAGQVTLEVADRFLPEVSGRFLLEVDADGPRCRPSRGPVDVRLTVGALAAVYFGATSGRAVLESGRAVASDVDAGKRFSALFRTDQIPFSGPEW